MKQTFNLLDPHWIEVVIIVVTLTFLMCGCKSVQYVPVKEVVHDSIYLAKVQKDSVWLHDSVYVKDRGDTVWLERWHTKYVERLRTDTIFETHVDSIPVPYEVVREVPAKMSKTQKGFMWFGIIAMMALVLIVGRWASKHIPRM
jgi:hypothetical protein